ncbi:MAG: hypothetical protein U0105_16025 [Candidatus Obscuribacterales bacterium]
MAHQQIDKTDESSQRVADLIAAFAHDLRAPLSGNASLLELMLADEFGAMPEQATDTLAVMLRGNRSMHHTLQLLVDVFQLEANQGELLLIENQTVSGAVQSAAASMDSESQARVNLDVASHISVRADREALQKVFSLLFASCLRKNAPEQCLHVTAVTTGIQTRIDIAGAAVPLQNLPDCESFKSLCGSAPRKKLPAGSVLAFYLSALTVQLHRGQMVAERHADDTTTITITLPAGAP